MTVTVRCYAAAAERLGARVEVGVATPTTAGALRAALAADHPEHSGLIDQCRIAVGTTVADATTPVTADDDVALLPPFAGGSGGTGAGAGDEPVVVVDLREPPLDVEAALSAISHPAAGAQVVFLGRVRDHSPADAAVHQLDYSAHDVMAREVLATIAAETVQRWPSLRGVALLHAVGELPVGAPTVLVACSSPHRDDAYDASRHALEELKARVPVWKRELGSQGARWVGLEDGAS